MPQDNIDEKNIIDLSNNRTPSDYERIPEAMLTQIPDAIVGL